MQPKAQQYISEEDGFRDEKTNLELRSNEVRERVINPHINLFLNIARGEAVALDIKTAINLLIDCEAHYGHRKSRWNPLMSGYIYGKHGNIHIFDLNKTVFLIANALNDIVEEFSARESRMLFVGTKDQASSAIKQSAENCDQYYVSNKWMGGALTNWASLNGQIRKMDSLARALADPSSKLSKKDKLTMARSYEKLNRAFSGMREMQARPNFIFITDTNKEKVAVKEAQRLKIPIIALLDTNSNPKEIKYPIPCNDDSKRTIELISELISSAVSLGLKNFAAKRSSRFEGEADDRRGPGGPRRFQRYGSRDRSNSRGSGDYNLPNSQGSHPDSKNHQEDSRTFDGRESLTEEDSNRGDSRDNRPDNSGRQEGGEPRRQNRPSSIRNRPNFSRNSGGPTGDDPSRS